MLALIAVLLAAAPVRCPAAKPCVVRLPGSGGGIGFDDVGFAPRLGQLLVPAGRSGSIALIDPASLAVTEVKGFSVVPGFGGGHDDGVTSADEGGGMIFATDRTRSTVSAVDPKTHAIRGHGLLAYGPDYVRYVAPIGEVWVTEPGREQIEAFRYQPGIARFDHIAMVKVPGGPESLVIDPVRGRAYANLWKEVTVAIDLRRHQVVARWPNGCHGARGLAIDAKRGLLFVGCQEGGVSVLSLTDGRRLATLHTGAAGVDIVAYSEALHHLYVPAAKGASLSVMDVGARGTLRLLRRVRTAAGSHCVAVAPPGRVLVCDPERGRLLVFDDAAR